MAYGFKILTASLFVCLLFANVSDAVAQSQNGKSRIDRLERDMETLSRAVYSGSASASSISPAAGGNSTDMAGYEVRVSQMEIEFRNMTGKIEQQEFLIRRLQEKVDKIIGDLEMRVGELERNINNSSSSSVTRKSVPSAMSGTVNKDAYPVYGSARGDVIEKVEITDPNAPFSPSAAQINNGGMTFNLGSTGNANSSAVYEYAFDLLKNGKYPEAEKEFKNFISDFPDDDLTSNAHYWLGETYYVRGNYERAARTFAEGFKEFPNSSKAPDNLLKLGLSLAGMDNIKDACITLKQIEKKFSSGSNSIISRAEREMERLNCDQ